jgi:hypothetical protein
VNLAPVPFARALASIVLPLAILAGCTGDTGSSPSPGPVATGAGAAVTIQPPASFGPPPSPTPPDDASPIVLDASLLAYLPESVGGMAVAEDADVAATALSDPGLPRIASAVEGAVAVDTGNSNLALAWIVRLRPGVFTDGDYRQWRDSYDEGACAGGGGVVGHAEATIGGRQTYVTSCVSAMRTYHVWLKDQDILISASSIGDGRFGEKLLEGIRVPA